MEMVYVTGNEHRHPWSTILSREFLERKRKGEGRVAKVTEEELKAHNKTFQFWKPMGLYGNKRRGGIMVVDVSFL